MNWPIENSQLAHREFKYSNAKFTPHLTIQLVWIPTHVLIFYLDVQIQERGLQRPYQTDNGTYTYLREVMAQPFLPHGDIEPMFVRLHAQATTATSQWFMEYISETWIHSNTCHHQAGVSLWRQFGQTTMLKDGTTDSTAVLLEDARWLSIF